MTGPILAAHPWPTNADLIADVARLGYLHTDRRTLDPTYGRGTWWKKWRPDQLVAHDLDPDLSPDHESVDFRHMPQYKAGEFPAVVFDPPYKLNGTPTVDVDGRYGLHGYTSREDRHQLILEGLDECARVLAPGGYLLVKCQDQVNGGRVRWQTDLVTERARVLGLRKVDAFHVLRYRPQPPGRTQVHARRNYSTLLVFEKGTP